MTKKMDQYTEEYLNNHIPDDLQKSFILYLFGFLDFVKKKKELTKVKIDWSQPSQYEKTYYRGRIDDKFVCSIDFREEEKANPWWGYIYQNDSIFNVIRTNSLKSTKKYIQKYLKVNGENLS